MPRLVTASVSLLFNACMIPHTDDGVEQRWCDWRVRTRRGDIFWPAQFCQSFVLTVGNHFSVFLFLWSESLAWKYEFHNVGWELCGGTMNSKMPSFASLIVVA